MKVDKFLRFFVFAVMLSGTTTYALADEETFTFQCQDGNTNDHACTNICANSYFASCSNFRSSNNVYVTASKTAVISLSKFKYHVTNVQWVRKRYLSIASGNTYVNDYAETSTSKESYSVWVNTDDNCQFITSSSFTNGCDGLKSFVIETEQGTGLIIVKSITVTYEKPVITLQPKFTGNIAVGSTGKLEAEIAEYAGAFVPGQDGASYVYSSSNESVATVDATGTVHRVAEGRVTITAKLVQAMPSGEIKEIASAEYVLMGKGEGVDWTRYGMESIDIQQSFTKTNASANPQTQTLYTGLYNYYADLNNNKYKTWQFKNDDTWYKSRQQYMDKCHWLESSSLKNQMVIWENSSSSNGTYDTYTQFAGFSVNAIGQDRSRIVAQKIECKAQVPKYSSVEYNYSLAGNVTLGTSPSDKALYGLEVVDLGNVNSADKAEEQITNISWDIASSSSSSSVSNSILRNGCTGTANYVGSTGNTSSWSANNYNGATGTTETRYVAAMCYIRNGAQKYPATASFGYKGTPTYTYYASITYDKNASDATSYMSNQENVSAVGTDGTITLNPTSVWGNAQIYRSGYVFLGWSTDKNATEATYVGGGQFKPYDEENGGGKGPVTLYAVWGEHMVVLQIFNKYGNVKNAQWSKSKNTADKIVSNVYKGQTMPAVDDPTDVPVDLNGEYDFLGFSDSRDPGNGTMYYGPNMEPLCKWDKDTYGVTLYSMFAKKGEYTKVTIDANGGVLPEKSKFFPTEVIAYGADKKSCTFVLYKNSNANNALKNTNWTDQVFTKPGYRLAGVYTNNTAHTKVYEQSSDNYQMNCAVGTYWNSSSQWLGTESELNLIAEYKKIYANENNSITFKGKSNVFLESEDEAFGKIKNYVINPCDVRAAIENGGSINPDVDVVDIFTDIAVWQGSDYSITTARDSMNAIMDIIEEAKAAHNISVNVLTYHKGTPSATTYNNVCYWVRGYGEEAVFQCDGHILLTDKEPITVRYQVTKASCDYDRILSNRGMLAQWGTICLPFDIDIKSANSTMEFYKLDGVSTEDGETVGTMTFTLYQSPYQTSDQNKYIKANTPFVYHLTQVGGGDNGVGIHQSNWELCMPPSNHVDQHAEESTFVDGWELIGTRTNRTFWGTSFSGTSDIHNYYLNGNDDGYDAIYYITYDVTQNKDVFARVPDEGKVTSPAYRAYFGHTAKAESKAVGAYNLIVYDEEGNSTDITDLLDNENAVGDGKIYDLNGVRVKNPIKGHIYIVNGKKKVY